jgi:hypothetical protein
MDFLYVQLEWVELVRPAIVFRRIAASNQKCNFFPVDL